MCPRIVYHEKKIWPEYGAKLIWSTIKAVLLAKGSCGVMLTGGRSAAKLYDAWNKIADFKKAKNIKFYFGDERCVPLNHPDSNYGMVLETLFKGGIPEGCEVLPMHAYESDRDLEAVRYSQILPQSMDVVLFGVGDDGHIASLFPNSSSLVESRKKVLPITGPKAPYERLTITPLVISQAREIFVLAPGLKKANILTMALRDKMNVSKFPACLVLDKVWLLDTEV